MSKSQRQLPHNASTTLQQEVQCRPQKRDTSSLLFGISLAVLGGFLGGVITSYGPTYLNVHVTQPVLQRGTKNVAKRDSPQAKAVVTPAPVDVAPLGKDANARLVVYDGPQAFVVLQNQASQEWAAKGSAIVQRPVKEEFSVHTYTQRVSTSALPQPLAQWQGQSLQLFDSKGFKCSARVDSFYLLEQILDPFDKGEDWNNPGELMLVAALTPSSGRCGDALWARDARLPFPSLARHTKATRSLRKAARNAFRSSSAHKALQAQYRKEGHRGHWDQMDFDSISIQLFSGPSEQILSISASVGGCGDFAGSLQQLYRVQPDQSLTAIPLPEHLEMGTIEAAVDVDGDGDLDFIAQSVWDRSIVEQSSKTRKTLTSSVQSDMCPC